jgi:hypothetical protein
MLYERIDWSRPLPRPIVIPDVMKLATLADVRALVEKHLPAEYCAKFTWRHLAGLLWRAAQGQEDAAEVATARQIVLQLEGVKYRL